MYYDRVPNMAGRGSGVPWMTPRKRRCTTGSSTSRCGQCWTSRGTMWRCPSLPARLSPWTWLGGVDACIRRAGKAEAGTKGYGAYWRPLTRWSGFTPGDAVEHRHATTGEDTAGEEEGGRRRREGAWPGKRDGGEGGRAAPAPEGWWRPGPCRAGLCFWRSSSTSARFPAVLEEDRAGATGRVHPGYLRTPRRWL